MSLQPLRFDRDTWRLVCLQDGESMDFCVGEQVPPGQMLYVWWSCSHGHSTVPTPLPRVWVEGANVLRSLP